MVNKDLLTSTGNNPEMVRGGGGKAFFQIDSQTERARGQEKGGSLDAKWHFLLGGKNPRKEKEEKQETVHQQVKNQVVGPGGHTKTSGGGSPVQ